VKGATWTFSAFLVIGMMGMLMITFRSSWLLTEDVDDDKVYLAPVEYGQGQEVEYDPSKALSPLDGKEEFYGLEQAQVARGTGIAAGVATGAAVAGSITSDDGSGSNQIDMQQGTGDAAGSAGPMNVDSSDGSITKDTQHSPSEFDDNSWLDDSSVPAGAQY
jgi:hypothetical protein